MAQDPYKYFRVEARELTEQLSRGALDLEKATQPADIVARLLRVAHTLKGAARVVKQREIADASHAVEDVLAPHRAGTSPVPPGNVNAILQLVDRISTHVTALDSVGQPEGSSAARPAVEEPLRTVRADVEEMDALLDGLAEVHVQLSAMRQDVRSLDRARQVATLLSERFAAPGLNVAPPSGGSSVSAGTAALAEEMRSLVTGLERNLTTGIERIDGELRQVRDTTERLRLVPVGTLFGALERTARDTAQAVGKRVAFAGRGGELRLDAHVLGIIQSALVQIVRNAVAHGIEPEAGRRAAGKAPEGRVDVEVVRRGERVAFIGRDDGRGVDVDAIRSAAQRKGLLSTGVHKLDAAELSSLLLKGGISTSRSISEVSGRGVGLDVVREAAQRLGGDVRVETTAGKGTVVEIVVPVSLSSLGALIVEASGIRAAIPIETVRHTKRIAPDEVVRTPDGETIVHEGRAVPFLALERSLSRVAGAARTVRPWSVVIVESSGATAAVGVDRLLGTVNIVLRSLPSLAYADAIVAGASLDADGNPQLVLDPGGLVARALRRDLRPPAVPPARLPILVIDDSPTTRMLEQNILEAAGYAVDLATSGEEAMEKAGRQAYALFLVDVEMPGMDGFTFVERTRADPVLRRVPAMLVTSRNAPEDRRRGEEAGACAYIVKSEFDQVDLLERIRRVVSQPMELA